MGIEACPHCGHPTKVYADAGARLHYDDCVWIAQKREREARAWEACTCNYVHDPECPAWNVIWEPLPCEEIVAHD